MVKFDCIEKPLSRLFNNYGQLICKHPLPFIFIPIFITLGSSVGLISIDSLTDAIFLFTPVNAQSKMERQIIHDLWPLVNGSYIPGRAVTQSREVQITVSAKDGGNILDKPYSNSVYILDTLIQKKVNVTYNGRKYRYADLCLTWRNQGCPGNKHVHAISDLYQHGINVTYPTIQIGSLRGYIGASLGGVSVGYGENNTMILARAHSWLMIYHLQFYPNNISYISGLWEKQFQLFIEKYQDKNIDITYFHSQTLAEELKRNADSLIPRFALAFSILIIFSVLCNMSTCYDSYYIDWSVSKPIVAVFGVLNAGMGIVTAIGLLNLVSVPYNDIVGVMPFLVVAVGVDNMFLMIAAIRRIDRSFNVSRRVGIAMSDAAISMLITALTDALSFGVGTITSIPAVQIFCTYTCVAISITFIYQMTFFAGLLALAIKWEASGLHCIFLVPTIPENKISSLSFFQKLFWIGSRPDPNTKDSRRNLQDSGPAIFFQNWYSPVLMEPVIRVLVVIWYAIYMTFAIYGCMQLREGLEPVNLLVEDSYAIPHYRALEKYFWHYGATVQVVVNNVPNLADPEERRLLKSLVHAFATNKHAIGDESIQFWMNEMEYFYQTTQENEIDLFKISEEQRFYSLVMHFISAKKTEIWPEDIAWSDLLNNTVPKIKSFRFLVGLRDISTSVQQQDATQTFREIATRYLKYNVTTFMPLWLFTDQYALVVPNTIQNIVIAMIVMVIIAFLLIPQPMCAFWVALAIASIDVGVIGYMTLWNVNLDAISMITIIMSIGFSVDYSAHITYGYVCSDQESPRDKIREALGSLGWPLTQGAVSTILAVVVLADVPAYMIVTFFKTVLLAISLGVLHGIVFLPVILAIFVRGFCTANSSIKSTSNASIDLFSITQKNKP